jgi:hypothetical protein
VVKRTGPRRLLALLALVLPASTAMAIEQPEYRSIERAGAFELREYAPYLIAETRVDADFMAAGNIAFGRLFRYISGANVPGQKIAMTAPVTQAPGEKIAMTAPVQQVAEGDDYLVGFIVPGKYTLETVPQPTDPRVRIREIPGGLVASWRYSGRWTESNFREAEALLRRELDSRRLVPVGAAQIARYNAPFMPAFLRRNEVLIPVTRSRQRPQ